MVPRRSASYGYGVPAQALVRKKSSARFWKNDIRNIFSAFLIRKKLHYQKHLVKDRSICSVDLGINTDAVCSIMRSDGTVLDGNLSISPVKKTGCPSLSEGSEIQKEHPVQSRSEADERMRNV